MGPLFSPLRKKSCKVVKLFSLIMRKRGTLEFFQGQIAGRKTA